MPQSIEPIEEPIEEPHERLPTEYAKALHAALTPLVQDKDPAAVAAFLDTAETLVARFCYWERRETEQPISLTKRELRSLRGKIYKFEATLRHLSAEALEELDLDMWREEAPPPDSGLPESQGALDLGRRAGLSKPAEDGPWSTYYVATTVLLLQRLGAAIDATLAHNNRGKGGAPRKLAWYNLAWQLGLALQNHFHVALTSPTDPMFEGVLRTCLAVTLRASASKRVVPEDLRLYTQDAVRILEMQRKT